MSVENIKKKVVASRLDYLTHKFSAHSHRKKHLQSMHKLTHEKMKSRYKNCAKTFGKSRSVAISKVEYAAYRCVIQVTSQHLIEQAIMKENSHRFILAYSSPLLQEETVNALGYSGEGQLSKNLLMHRAMLETRDERLKDLMKLFHNSPHSKKHPFVTVDQWNEHWSHSTEKTASSASGLHYGHYKAHTSSPLVSSVKCNLVNLVVTNSTPLERWICGVSIMLEKSPGNLIVEKLRALLLLEADFNGLHKINFNGRLMPYLEVTSSMPQEIIGDRRSQAATHLALSKKLIADTSNIRKLPMVSICADATNCYDRVAHPYGSLYSQYFGLDIHSEFLRTHGTD